ncbi:DNA-directed RNA polymerase subunit beta'' [Frankliniella fusca]|uniref:DNA-directed RNA polymerase subunit beta n=1 Tax=Frankliniella fusca TaxID=407009 RepID=A0AAE1HGV1_9NEOP|nr:DNA-directed RNA polymerase subunit beta'' [Frankliniella fusca]KAK3925944.1 DNA-directed RNA polymerase subunit beta'' [Frankliniella fusca]
MICCPRPHDIQIRIQQHSPMTCRERCMNQTCCCKALIHFFNWFVADLKKLLT